MTPLKEARLRAGLTAIEAARRAGTTENRVFALERGRFRPKRFEAEGLARALGVDVDALFPDGVQPCFVNDLPGALLA